MNAIEEIEHRLAYPQARFQVEGNDIRLLPLDATGFEVSLSGNASSCTVGFSGWHEELEGKEMALNCFTFDWSPVCRFKVIYCWKFPQV